MTDRSSDLNALSFLTLRPLRKAIFEIIYQADLRADSQGIAIGQQDRLWNQA
jgi:hypothetical protein